MAKWWRYHTIATTYLGGTALEGVGLAGGVRLGGGWYTQQRAEIEKVRFGDGALLLLRGDTLGLLELVDIHAGGFLHELVGVAAMLPKVAKCKALAAERARVIAWAVTQDRRYELAGFRMN